MTTLLPDPVTTAPGNEPRSRALSARRWALVASPVLAGLFITIGLVADPAPGISGRELYELYGANPDPLQFKSLGLHYGYAFLVLPALLVGRLVRGRGAWLANAAGVFGFLGISTLPGLLFVDYYDSAIVQLYGADGAEAVSGEMEQMWGVAAFVVPGLLGTALGTLLAALALWRAGLVPWWAPLSVVLSLVAFGGSNALWWGGALMTALLAAYAVALARATADTQPGGRNANPSPRPTR